MKLMRRSPRRSVLAHTKSLMSRSAPRKRLASRNCEPSRIELHIGPHGMSTASLEVVAGRSGTASWGWCSCHRSYAAAKNGSAFKNQAQPTFRRLRYAS